MIIVDMNLSPDWVVFFSTHGFASVHWRDLGPAHADDRLIFDHARQSSAIILTQDLDFGAILAQTGAMRPSVVLLRLADLDPAQVGGRVIEALRKCADELAVGAILTIDEHSPRLRLLPLRRDDSNP